MSRITLLAVLLFTLLQSFFVGAAPTSRSGSDGNCMENEEICMKTFTWRNEVPWECVDTMKSSENCGGCMNPMYEDQVVGRDCTIIPGQKTVSCVEGVCQVQACQSGWYASKDKQACYEKYDEGD